MTLALSSLFDDWLPRSTYDYDILGHVPRTSWAFQPRCDIFENDKELLIHCEIPGVSKETVKVELIDNLLKIRGRKELSSTLSEDLEKGKLRFRRSERNFGDFETSVRLPRGTDSSKMKTSLSSGLLEIRVPKPHPKKISIDVGEK